MEMALAEVMGPFYLLLGLSVLLYAKQWMKLYKMFAKDHFVLLPLMFMMIVLGLIVIHLHNVWEWNVWLLITVTGWGMFLKGALYLLAPENVIKSVMKMGQNSALMYFGGLVGLVFGAVLTYYAYLA